MHPGTVCLGKTRMPSHRPAAAIAISFSIGIAFSLICREYSFGCLAVASLLLTGASLLALHRNRLLTSFFSGQAALVLSGLLMALAHRDGYPGHDLRSLLKSNAFPLSEPALFEGCVAEKAVPRGEETVATIELHGFQRGNRWLACRGGGLLRIFIGSTDELQTQGSNLMPGDRVRGWAAWNVPRNFQNPGSPDRIGLLARRGIYLVGRAKSPRLLESISGDCSNPVTRMANAVRNRTLTSLAPIRGEGKTQPAAILASLLIGDYSGLDNRTREIFQNSGTFHVLVVSGLHIAWIASVFLGLAKLFHLPERLRYMLAILLILLFACVVGFEASITRCLWMFLLYLVGRMIIRRADTANVLFAAAVSLLAIQPDWLFETGFQLSFLSILAIVMTAVPFIERYLRPLVEPLKHSGEPDRLFLTPGQWHRRGRKLRALCEILVETMADARAFELSRWLLLLVRIVARAAWAVGGMIVVSISVQLWLEPIFALCFNRLSWISPLANLFIVPFSSLVLASGALALLLEDLYLCGPALLQIAGSLASLLLQSADSITKIPGAWQRCPTPSVAWVLGGILLLFVWSLFQWQKSWIPAFYIVALLACLSFGSVPMLGNLVDQSREIILSGEEAFWGNKPPPLRITILDVGQGDSIVTRFPNGQIWVIDAGGLGTPPFQEDSTYAFDVGEAIVSRFLWQAWITKLDRMVLSHSDLDHAGGIPALLKNFRVLRLDHSPVVSDKILSAILNIAETRRTETGPVHAGMEETIGGVSVRILSPPAYPEQRSTNENSLVLGFYLGQFSALLPGDLEKAGEADFIVRSGSLCSLLLKVAHHGSRGGTSDALLDHISPRWAVISAGRNNPFGHPSKDVMRRLWRHGVRTIQTLDEGAITFETDGNAYRVKTDRSGVLESGFLK
jgi:competence protein ComEC